MASVIIGHTTHERARIWVRGDWRFRHVQVSLESQGAPRDEHASAGATQCAWLSPWRDYTRVIEFAGLAPRTQYIVRTSFGRTPWRIRASWLKWLFPRGPTPMGRLRTLPAPLARTKHVVDSGSESFTFLLGSCNLSNIKVNNLLGLVAGFIGSYTVAAALRRPANAASRDFFIVAGIKSAASWLAQLFSYCVYKLTGYRQPTPPFLMSPFLRLAALFGTSEVTITAVSDCPPIGRPVVGDRSGAEGLVGLGSESAGAQVGARLLLIPTNDRAFAIGERIRWGEKVKRADGREEEAVAEVVSVSDFELKSAQPDFVLHVGDQIYFDFPIKDPKPTLRNYRRTYREVWCEDVVAARFLAQCPQYMTLDDHEIFDNFSTDAPSPTPKLMAVEYARHARRAYREYVHGRHPELPADGASCEECGKPLGGSEVLYYTFARDGAYFFVMDTRTERYSGGLLDDPGRMISCCQMQSFKNWLSSHRRDLVFIVSSVPFVPEIYATADEGRKPNNRSQKSVDKWCAPAFVGQREEILRHIWKHDIERVVFLAGDMHCCYHATMRIRMGGEPDKSLTINELAAGPLYQLRLSRASDFYESYRGAFGDGDRRLTYASRIQQLYSLANAVMSVSVDRPNPRLREPNQATLNQNIRWSVLQTVGEPREARSSSAEPESNDSCAPQEATPDTKKRGTLQNPFDPAPPVMSGQISLSYTAVADGR